MNALPVRVWSTEPVDGGLTQVAANAAVDPLERVLAPNEVILQDVQHLHHLRENTFYNFSLEHFSLKTLL